LAQFHNTTTDCLLGLEDMAEHKMYRRIRDLREDADMTQTQMAQILSCSQRVYSNYELGQRDIPTDILIRLARFHNTTTDYLLGLTDVRERPWK
jgi:transcriptional regulator with XRE-family HTH domain